MQTFAPPISPIRSTWHRMVLLLIVALLAGTLLDPGSALAAPAADGGTPDSADSSYGAGYRIAPPFLAWLQLHGGVAALGAPITQAFAEDDLTLQYFQFGRLEQRADAPVELTALGRLAAAAHPQPTAFRWVAAEEGVARDPERTYLSEAGHTLGGAFRWYWQTHGAVSVLGYPISEELVELAVGGPQLVQYFERAVLVYDATADADAAVRRLPLGIWDADQRALPAAARAPTPPPTILATATLPFNPASGDGQNIMLAASRLNGATLAAGQRLGFVATIGGISEANGYQDGSGIANGVLTTMVGGGVCVVATALYRAVWDAGLPVVARTGHRFWLRPFASEPGLDAAVADPGLELQIGNDTPAPIRVEATARGGRLVVRLWGEADGRRVTRAPTEVQTPNDNPQRDGAIVITTRTIAGGPWAAPRVERVTTVYQPLPAPPTDPTEPTSAPRQGGGTPS